MSGHPPQAYCRLIIGMPRMSKTVWSKNRRRVATAGYDPREAVSFWERVAKGKDGKAPLEFLSTHPSDETRVRQIRDLLPEALNYYKRT